MPMSDDVLEPRGRVVMISGASRGIGAAIARRLYADGFSLSLGARTPAAALTALGEHDDKRVLAARFDAHDVTPAGDWHAGTLRRFGRLDALINNAGVLRHVGFDDNDETALEEMWAVNVKAPLRLIRLALPSLRRSGTGRIINVASTDGKRYRDASVSIGYAMTKHALVALTHGARFAAWNDGVRVTALCPGAVETELLSGIPGATPSGQRMSPRTIAHTVSFLLSLPNVASAAELSLNARLESTV
jgi:NAD(P)-dependent dehydrogenase (short-subunit alcohol dehydrogenase family)